MQAFYKKIIIEILIRINLNNITLKKHLHLSFILKLITKLGYRIKRILNNKNNFIIKWITCTSKEAVSNTKNLRLK